MLAIYGCIFMIYGIACISLIYGIVIYFLIFSAYVGNIFNV